MKSSISSKPFYSSIDICDGQIDNIEDTYSQLWREVRDDLRLARNIVHAGDMVAKYSSMLIKNPKDGATKKLLKLHLGRWKNFKAHVDKR